MLNIYKNLIKHKPRIQFGLPLKNLKKVLVLAPHPDDETLGCGGTVANLTDAGVSVQVVLFTSQFNGSGNRISEFHNALKALGISQFITWDFKDKDLNRQLKYVIGSLTDLLKHDTPDIILSPYVFDYNTDHIAVVQALSRSLNRDSQTKVYMYEIWTPILYPNVYCDISSVIEQKIKASRFYESQQQTYGTIQQFIHLNHYRADMIRSRGYRYSEAFLALDACEFIDTVSELLTQDHWGRA
jgi:LmbE family N-acetylglucosaminyl deacetylase